MDDIWERLKKPEGGPKSYAPIHVFTQQPRQEEEEKEEGEVAETPTLKGPQVPIFDKTSSYHFDRSKLAQLKKRGRTAMTPVGNLQEPVQEEKVQEEKEEPQGEEGEANPLMAIPTGKKVKKGKKGQEPASAHVLQEMKWERLPVADTILLNGEDARSRLPPNRLHIDMRTSPFYANNRKLFVEDFTRRLEPYARKLESKEGEPSCDPKPAGGAAEFDLMLHQQVVREYLNLFTPYRGLLLYHGLGSGKTCTSIGIAEGMKSGKEIVLMTPASLKANFFTELKKCGDPVYKTNQFWEFVKTEGHADSEVADPLSLLLNLSPEEIKKKGGAWLVDVRKPANYEQLNDTEKQQISDQLDVMIRAKYIDLNYNGLRANSKAWTKLTNHGAVNPFDNRVVIIDEAHKFISGVVSKIRTNATTTLPHKMYELLMNAQNARVILLTGTPLVNYPNEIAVLYNILRGSIKVWEAKVTGPPSATEDLDGLLERGGLSTYDVVQLGSNNVLSVTRNPFGFVNRLSQGKLDGKLNDKLNDKLSGGKTPTYRDDTDHVQNQKEDEAVSSVRTPSVRTPTARSKTRSSRVSARSKTAKRTPSVRNSTPVTANPLVTAKPLSLVTAKPLIEGETEQEDSADSLVNVTDTVNHPSYYYVDPYTDVVYGDPSSHEQRGGGLSGEIVFDEQGNIDDATFEGKLAEILTGAGLIRSSADLKARSYKALPDKLDDFAKVFMDLETQQMKNKQIFQKRILGLTSFFRSEQENLMPSFVMHEATYGDPAKKQMMPYKVVPVPMSDHQFGLYVEKRNEEADAEKKSKKPAAAAAATALFSKVSTYRMYSRECCNFVFPDEIKRPYPKKKGEDKGTNAAKAGKGGAKGDRDETDEWDGSQIDLDIVEPYLGGDKDGDKGSDKDEWDGSQIDLDIAEPFLGGGDKEGEGKDRPLPRPAASANPSVAEYEEGVAEEAREEQLLAAEDRFDDVDEEDDVETVQEEDEDEDEDGDEGSAKKGNKSIMDPEYKRSLRAALHNLYTQRSKFLTREGLKTCSPKFLRILESVMDEKNKGLHLIYSQFRDVEGIEVLKYVLETNGMEEFTVKRDADGAWVCSPLTAGKKRFLLFTGTESAEKKHILLNVYNGNWSIVPEKIREALQAVNANNMYGELVSVFMITSSGAEGISLTNTRYVHIVEPYWHFVRLEQVIGRARRICSHKDLPKELQTVEVFIYLSVLSEEQKERNKSGVGNKQIELRDTSKRHRERTFTTDETIFELAQIKDENNQTILNAVKEASIDCALYNKEGKGQPLMHCFSFGQSQAKDLAYKPSVEEDMTEIHEQVKTGKRFSKIPYRGAVYRIDLTDPAQQRAARFTLYDDAEYGKGRLKAVGFAKKDMQGKFDVRI